MAAQAALVTALAELGSMTGDRLRLDQATVVNQLFNTLPEVRATHLGRDAMPTGGPAALPTAHPTISHG